MNQNNFQLKLFTKCPILLDTIIGKKLAHDKFFMFEAIKQNKECIYFLPPSLKDDADFMLNLMKLSPNYIYHASDMLKKSKEFIVKAYAIDHVASTHAMSYELRNDADFLINYMPSSIQIAASKELLQNKQFVLRAIAADKTNALFVSEFFKNDAEYMLNVIKIFPYNFRNASSELKNNKQFVLECLKNGVFGYEISEELRNDMNFMLEAIKIDPNNSMYISPELKNNRQFQDTVCFMTGGYVDANVALNAIRSNPHNIYNLNASLKHNFDFMMKVADINPDIFLVAPSEVQNNIDFINACEYAKMGTMQKQNNEMLANQVDNLQKVYNLIQSLSLQLIEEHKNNIVLKQQLEEKQKAIVNETKDIVEEPNFVNYDYPLRDDLVVTDGEVYWPRRSRR